MRVVTANNKMHTKHKGDKAETPLTKEEATKIANEANKRAKELGIKTKYKVVD